MLRLVKMGSPAMIFLYTMFTEPTGIIHQQLIGMKLPDFPVAMGVIRAVEAPVYDQVMETQIAGREKQGKDQVDRRSSW